MTAIAQTAILAMIRKLLFFQPILSYPSFNPFRQYQGTKQAQKQSKIMLRYLNLQIKFKFIQGLFLAIALIALVDQKTSLKLFCLKYP
ncbi:MAG: hypothetical protein ACKO2V_13740 [Snowella sp.]